MATGLVWKSMGGYFLDLMMPPGILNSRKWKGLSVKKKKKSTSCCNILHSPPRSPPASSSTEHLTAPDKFLSELLSGETGNKTNDVNFWEIFVLRGPNWCSLELLGILVGTSTNHRSLLGNWWDAWRLSLHPDTKAVALVLTCASIDEMQSFLSSTIN